MSGDAKQTGRRAIRAAAVALAGFASVAVLPGAFAAVSDLAERPLSILASDGGLGVFTPASADPNLMKSLRKNAAEATRGSRALYRFTPSGSAQRGERAITVAVRVDQDTASAVSVRNAAERAGAGIGGDVLGVAPVKFNLGVAREYQTFAQADDSVAANRSLGLSSEIRTLSAPDLSSFTPAKSGSKSRFSPQVAFEGEILPGRAPRTLRGQGDVSVDVGGAYRVADNLRVTAGIRYNSDRDRTQPLPTGTQDSQAVYVGTRFRF